MERNGEPERRPCRGDQPRRWRGSTSRTATPLDTRSSCRTSKAVPRGLVRARHSERMADDCRHCRGRPQRWAEETVGPAVFIPYTLNMSEGTQILVRSDVPPLTLMHAVRKQVSAVNPEQQIYSKNEDLERLDL